MLRREPVLEVAPQRFHVDGLTTLRYLTQRLGVEYEPTHDGLITASGLLSSNSHSALVAQKIKLKGFLHDIDQERDF